MKKILFLTFCFLFLLQVSAFAEIDKTITNTNYISISSQYAYSLADEKKTIWLTLTRSSYSTNSYTDNSLQISLAHHYKFPMAFAPNKRPYLILSTNDADKLLMLKDFRSLSYTSDTFGIDAEQVKQILSASKIFIAIDLADAPSLKIEVPSEILKEWNYLLTCDLRDEYNKGI
ncbi:MAG: hypothetical protein E6713_05950 [Sporomusaceae bacterium]|nr:hypothetical protein [Sporomusaceae bacterium]